MRVLLTAFIILFSAVTFAQKTESPYLQVNIEDAIIPLKSTKADIQIVGRIAHVKITQTYQNQSKTPIEAKYVFPMSTQAAVHDMKMVIGKPFFKSSSI